MPGLLVHRTGERRQGAVGDAVDRRQVGARHLDARQRGRLGEELLAARERDVRETRAPRGRREREPDRAWLRYSFMGVQCSGEGLAGGAPSTIGRRHGRRAGFACRYARPPGESSNRARRWRRPSARRGADRRGAAADASVVAAPRRLLRRGNLVARARRLGGDARFGGGRRAAGRGIAACARGRAPLYLGRALWRASRGAARATGGRTLVRIIVRCQLH